MINWYQNFVSSNLVCNHAWIKQILLITRMITDQIGPHSVLLPLLIRQCLPIKTEKKNCVMGTSRTGEDMLRNQLGDIGNSLKNNRKKNKLSRFSLT